MTHETHLKFPSYHRVSREKVFKIITRMHSSRMCTTRFSDRLCYTHTHATTTHAPYHACPLPHLHPHAWPHHAHPTSRMPPATYAPPLWKEWLTDRCKSITFPQLRLRVVKTLLPEHLSDTEERYKHYNYQPAPKMVTIKFSVILALLFGLVVAEEFDTKAEIETPKRRMDNLESSLGK